MRLTIEQLELSTWVNNYLTKCIETDNLYSGNLHDLISKDLKDYPEMIRNDLEEILSNLLDIIKNV